MITFDENKFKSYVVGTTITDNYEDEDGWVNFKVTLDIGEKVEVPFTFYTQGGLCVYPNDWQDFENLHEAGEKIFGLFYRDSNQLSRDFSRFIYKLGVAEYKKD